VTGERSDEPRHLPVALAPAQLRCALSIPAAHQCWIICRRVTASRTAVARAWRAVDHDQQPAVGVEAPVDQLGEQGGDDGLVLDVAHHRPTGTLVPSPPIASATTQQASANGTPSSINAARSNSERSRLINSSSCASVAALTCWETPHRTQWLLCWVARHAGMLRGVLHAALPTLRISAGWLGRIARDAE
jgi:hypothetical protein